MNPIGMTTPCSPSETTASSETTSSSSIDDLQISYTIGVTEGTPYPCTFCDKAFPRLSYLKRHEQGNSGHQYTTQQLYLCFEIKKSTKEKRLMNLKVKGNGRHDHNISILTYSGLSTGLLTSHSLITLRNGGKGCVEDHPNHLQLYLRQAGVPLPPPPVVFPIKGINIGQREKTEENHGLLGSTASYTLPKPVHSRCSSQPQYSIHSDQMPFRCDYCQRLFKHKRSRDRHVKLHTGDKRYRCCHCESAFSRSDHLKIHMKTHDQMKPFQCAVCNRGYNTAAALTSHMQNHKRNNTINTVGNNNGNTSTRNINGNNGIVNNNSDNKNIKNITLSTTNSLRLESRGETTSANKVSPDPITRSGSQMSANNSSPDSHPESTQTQLTCGFCGIKCTSLETHIRQTHLHHLLFAGLLQNSFCQSAGIGNWPSLMPPPPPIPPVLTPVNDLMKLHSSIPNGSSSPPSPKKAKTSKSVVAPTTPTPPQPTQLPILCNFCSPSPAFHDFESFRSHINTHIIAQQPPPPPHHNSHLSLAAHSPQCPHCGQTVTTDFDSHLINCHMGTVTTNYGCECCTKMFSKPDELQKHLMDIHAHHLYQCSLCRDMFDSKVSIQVHFAVKHSNECKIFKCNICGEFFNSEHDFKLHVKIVHFQPNGAHLSPPQPQLAAAFPLYGSKAYFRCKYCSEEFNIEYLLERHIDIEHSHHHKLPKTNCLDRDVSQGISQMSGKLQQKAIKCEFCSKSTFKSVSELESHMNSEHKSNSNVSNSAVNGIISSNGLTNHNKGSNKCNICDELFASISQLAEHKLKKHCIFGASQCLQCLHCHDKINTRDDYMRHFVEHNNINKSTDSSALNALFPVVCVICKQTLMSEVEIDMHASYHCDQLSTQLSHNSSANDKHSGGTTSPASPVVTESKLNAIKNECHSPKGLAISADKSGVSPKLENNSIESADDMTVTNKRYQCIKCQESFRSEAEIKDHVHQHMLNEGSIECKLCDREFDSPAKLQSHLIEHNFNGGDEYKCHLCQSIFNGSQSLQAHMFDDHLNDRPFSCGQCSLKFWFPTELDNHSMAEHRESDDDEEEDIDCDNCSEVSNTEIMSSTAANDRFKCIECDKEFPLESHLMLHLKSSHHQLATHLDNQTINEKRFSCNICGKKFARKEARKLHYKSHH
ncbi:unnamed protein product [Oppiella nova]|uniref:C2H2-type domain-containing protein n=1 Tax=Oppiella nova TaxID=334625 RepID=A0A7R9LG15_9ACAR|nr:unnamed protein product [Oppiella nova]CAG2163296.1 unnamed protein product [Oppiella nova]